MGKKLDIISLWINTPLNSLDITETAPAISGTQQTVFKQQVLHLPMDVQILTDVQLHDSSTVCSTHSNYNINNACWADAEGKWLTCMLFHEKKPSPN